MASGLTAPTTSFIIDDPNVMLAMPCHVYYSIGTLDPTDIPTTAAALTALYTGATPKFKPFGTQAKGGAKFTYEPKLSDVFQHQRWTGGATKLQINLVHLTESMVTFMDATEAKQKITFLFVPIAMPATPSVNNPVFFVAVTGVYIAPAVDINFGGDVSGLNWVSNEQPINISDQFKYKAITS